MLKKLFPIFILIFSFFAYGLFLSQFNVSIIPDSIKPSHPSHYYDYSGITHIHSNRSSGSGSVLQITSAAQKSNLDFIFITDLNQFPYKNVKPQHVNNLLIFSGYEYSYLNSKIINFFPKVKNRPSALGQTQVLLTELLSQKVKDESEGLFVVSHPFKKDSSWEHNSMKFVEGLEIFNLKKIWQNHWESQKLSFLWTLFLYPFNPRLAFLRLFNEPTQEVQLWDKMLKSNTVLGFSGSDAEAQFSLSKELSFSYPTYEDIFSITKNHVLLESELTGDYQRDAHKIEAAIKNGQFYFSLDLLANPKGFEAYIEDKDKKIFPIGSKVTFKENLKLIVHLSHKPKVPTDVILYKDSEKQVISNSQHSEFPIHSPGVYRILVKVIPTLPLPDGRKWLPWIYTNPFFVK